MSVNFSVLQNGLLVVTDFVPYSSFVIIQVFVKTGSRSEVIENNGIAHFLEHMAFKGTHSRSAEDIAIAFDDLGANFNAHTSKESTVYYVKVLKECFLVAMEIISDIILNSKFDEVELEREKLVVLEEIAETNDDPGSILVDKFVETSFPNQAIGRSILGTKETVMNFGKNSLLDFVEDHYHAKNIFLVVSGNVNHNDVVENTNKFFSSLSSKNVNINLEKAVYIDSLEYREERELEQVHVMFGVNGVSFCDDLYYAVQMLSVILGGSMSSRLFQEVREKRGLVYSISTFSMNYSDSGIFGVYACTTHGNLMEMLDVTCAELRKIKTTLSISELERARKQLKSSLLMKMEGIIGRATYICKSLHYFGKYIPVDEVINKIDAVDINKLQCSVDRIMNFKNPTFGAIGKLNGLPKYEEIVNMF